jgi:hypothetical protein
MAEKKDYKFDDEQILKDFTNIFPSLRDPYREILERGWFRNILYFLGEQWFDILRTSGLFAARYRLNWGVPTPVSNIIRDHVKSMNALTLNKNYKARVWPNSNETADKDAAEMGSAVLPWLDAESDGDIDDVKEMTALWTNLIGSGFTRTFAGTDDRKVNLIDGGGNAIKQADVIVDSLLPFNVVVPTLGLLLNRKKWIGVKTLQYKEWVEDTYDTKLNDNSDASAYQVDYQKQLLQLIANVSTWIGQGGVVQEMNTLRTEDLVVMQEVEFAPTKQFPKGRYAAVVNGQVVTKAERLPIPVGKDKKWSYTVDHFIYNRVPGSFWPTGSVDDLISPQNTINQIDQALARNRKSLGRPMVLTPTELTIRRLSERSQDLLSIQYEGARAAGSRPQLLSGVPYPNQVLEERDIQRQVAQDAGGDPKNVLRGKAPYAGAPGIALDILRETAEQSHGPDIARFYRTWQRIDRKRLIIVASTFSDTRMIKIKGKGNEVMVKHFKGSDLRGNTDVRLERVDGLSLTNAGKNQFLVQLLQYGMWDEQRGPKPDVRRELLRVFGLGGFPEEDNIHRARAEYENSMIVAGGKFLEDIATPPMPTGENDEDGQPIVVGNEDPVFELDDHFSHVQVLGQLIFSKEFGALSKLQKSIATLHYQFHTQKLAEQMQAEQEIQQEAAANAQGGQAGPGQPGGGPMDVG